MHIETERLILREFRAEDLCDVHEYASDPENVKHMMFGPNTVDESRGFLLKQCAEEMAESPRTHYNIALELRETGKVLGGVSLHLNWRRDDAILGAIINLKYGGHGYMTEALRAVLSFAFGELKLHRVHAVCAAENKPMAHVFEKLGMRYEGTMVKRGKSRPGAESEYFDQLGYAMLTEEWRLTRREENG